MNVSTNQQSPALEPEIEGDARGPRDALAAFKTLFAELDKSNLERIEEVFSSDIVFIDPFHEVRGIENLKTYYSSMYENLNSITFVFDEDIVEGNLAVITWTMIYSHPKLKGGEELRVAGVSRLEFEGDRVKVHRDYFDAGELLYEHVPVVGWAVRKIKQRL